MPAVIIMEPTQAPTTVTYYIDFHDAYMARNFTLAEIDPFILVQYGTAGENFWEVHTHPYKAHGNTLQIL